MDMDRLIIHIYRWNFFNKYKFKKNKTMKRKILISPLLIFVFILAIFFYLLTKGRDPSQLPSVLLNKEIPNFESDSIIAGKRFISKNEFTNEIIVVNFFATWCKPCRNEHAYIKNLSKNKKIKIIGINYKDHEKKTIKWLKELGNPYSSIALDKDGRIAIEWGVYGIPETFVINSKNIIKYRQAGPITKNIYKKINNIIKNIE